jgi:hypothetical protein
LTNNWIPQRAASQFGLPAGTNAKWWVVAGESVSRVGNYQIKHIGTGRTFSYDGDGHLYLNHTTGANYLRLDDTGVSLSSYDNTSFTYAVVVDLDLDDGVSGNANYAQTNIIQAQISSGEVAHALYIFNNSRTSNPSPGTLLIDNYQPTNYISGTWTTFADDTTTDYTGKILLVTTYQYTSSSSQTVTYYKDGIQTFTASGDDSTSESRTFTHYEIAGASNSTQGGFQSSKFYAAVLWDRVLTTDEISQLTIDKLVTKRQTMPISDLADITNVSTTAPTNGQALVWNDFYNEWKPENIVSSGDKSISDGAKGEPGVDGAKGEPGVDGWSRWYKWSRWS